MAWDRQKKIDPALSPRPGIDQQEAILLPWLIYSIPVRNGFFPRTVRVRGDVVRFFRFHLEMRCALNYLAMKLTV